LHVSYGSLHLLRHHLRGWHLESLWSKTRLCLDGDSIICQPTLLRNQDVSELDASMPIWTQRCQYGRKYANMDANIAANMDANIDANMDAKLPICMPWTQSSRVTAYKSHFALWPSGICHPSYSASTTYTSNHNRITATLPHTPREGELYFTNACVNEEIVCTTHLHWRTGHP
jgi:hypothetical protein